MLARYQGNSLGPTPTTRVWRAGVQDYLRIRLGARFGPPTHVCRANMVDVASIPVPAGAKLYVYIDDLFVAMLEGHAAPASTSNAAAQSLARLG